MTTHLLLADRVMEIWTAAPAESPFDPADDDATNAFRQGAFGPDLGYFPGGSRALSDLAHCVRSGDLTRSLVRDARSCVERAFALGWLTHVLADRWIHPLVGRAVGELLHGRPDRFVDGDRAPLAHVRVEAGLDAWLARRHPELRRRPPGPVFSGGSIGFLHDAFRDVYDVEIDRDELLRSHRAAARGAAHGLRLAALTAPGMAGNGRSKMGLRSLLARQSLVLAYLLPSAPPGWFLDAVDAVLTSFPERFLDTWRGGLARLPNVNLDTGRPDGVDADHGGTRRALALLESLGACPLLAAPREVA